MQRSVCVYVDLVAKDFHSVYLLELRHSNLLLKIKKYFRAKVWAHKTMSRVLGVGPSMFSVAEATIQSQMYVRVPVHLSIIKTTQPFRILIFGHQDHWPSYLSAIMPINYHSHDHQHSCKSGTKGNRIRLLYEIYTTHNLVLYESIFAIWSTKPIKHIHLPVFYNFEP